METQDTTGLGKNLVDGGLSKVTAVSSGEADMSLPSDAISLPPQQPPSTVTEKLDSELTSVNGDAVEDSAMCDIIQNASSMDGAQSKEPENLDDNSLSDGLHPMEE